MTIKVDFGQGEFCRIISINEIFDRIGQPAALGLIVFHCFTGCDSTCYFYGVTRPSWYKSWMIYPDKADLTAAFEALSW